MSLLLNLFLISYAASFLTLYPGARQTGMGGVFCSIADDAYGTFYNPAGSAFQREFKFEFERNTIRWPWGWTVPTKYWNAASILPLTENFSFGFFGSFVDKEKLSHHDTDTSYDFTTGLSLGYKLNKSLSVGFNIKYIYTFYASHHPQYGIDIKEIGKTFAIDVGHLEKYSFLFGTVGIGLSVYNIGPVTSYSPYEVNSLPLSIKAGISYAITAEKIFKINEKNQFIKNGKMTIAFDIIEIIDEDPWYSFGVEIYPISFLALRFGLFDDINPWRETSKGGWTAGLGIDLKFLRLDISDDSAFFEYSPDRFRFSLSLNIGQPIFPKNGIFGK